MKKPIVKNTSRRSGGSRILASLREAVDWVEGKDLAVRVTSDEHAHNGLASARQDGRVPRPLEPGLRGLCAPGRRQDG